MATTIYIGGLEAQTDEAVVRSLCSDYGEISETRLVTRANGECRGFAYVTFDTHRAATKARNALDGRKVGGHRLRVAVAK